MQKSTSAFPEIDQRLLPLLFVIAFPGEAEILNHMYPFQRIKKVKKIKLFQLPNHKVFLAIAGTSIEKKSVELEYLLREMHPSLVINYGVCGGLDLSLPLFNNILVKQVRTLHQPLLPLSTFAPKLYEILWSFFPTGSLLTTDSPIKISDVRDELFLETGCQLIDMEGYHLVRIAHRYSIPLIILKQLVDYCDAETIHNFRYQKARWQKGLREGLLNLFDIFKRVKSENL